MQLEQEQEELLSSLVEAYRNVPRNKRQPFWVRNSDKSNFVRIEHDGLPNREISAYEGDIKTLGREGLVEIYNYSNVFMYSFDITSAGFAYYSQLKQHDSQRLQRIEVELRAYLESDRFQKRYAKAYQKWKDAEAILWDSDSERQLTTIGHLCREAVQEFASVLADQFQVEADKTKIIAPLRAVLNIRENQLGTTERPFLDALLSYWGTVCDLIQRQEHGSRKEGQPLVWEDGRRVVFQTAILMFEVDRSLSR
jgi:hypothetical protein